MEMEQATPTQLFRERYTDIGIAWESLKYHLQEMERVRTERGADWNDVGALSDILGCLNAADMRARVATGEIR